MNTLTHNPTAAVMMAQQIMLERATAARRRAEARELRAARRADLRAARRNGRPRPHRVPSAAFRFLRSAS
jgi:hypothetical protein